MEGLIANHYTARASCVLGVSIWGLGINGQFSVNQQQIVHVAVGIVINNNSEVLVTFRAADSHQGGLWEFPGGKVEPGEMVQDALKREFEEEVGITVHEAVAFIKIEHHYSDKSVLLDVWKISQFSGNPVGKEGQALAWRPIAGLQVDDFPRANERIIRSLALPDRIAITPEAKDFEMLTEIINKLFDQGLDIIHFRQKTQTPQSYQKWFSWADKECKSRQIKLMFSSQLHDYKASFLAGISGFHATSSQLLGLKSRPVSKQQLFSASCHDLEQLKLAESLDADFVYLSPVMPTAKYQADQLLGWRGFQHLVDQVDVPVYALGGLDLADMDICKLHRGVGIAGISTFRPG